MERASGALPGPIGPDARKGQGVLHPRRTIEARAAPAPVGANAPAARFVDDDYQCGVIPWQRGELCCYFNWNSAPLSIELPLGSRDFWSDKPLPAGAHSLAGYAGLVTWHPLAD